VVKSGYPGSSEVGCTAIVPVVSATVLGARILCGHFAGVRVRSHEDPKKVARARLDNEI
jgi:hypothetical protein